jgi:hypothetical protein
MRTQIASLSFIFVIFPAVSQELARPRTTSDNTQQTQYTTAFP